MSKTIIVPKNEKAEIALNYDTANSDEIIEINLTNEEFKRLWDKNIFHLINRISNCNIDEFEDEHIVDLDFIYNSWNELRKNNDSSEEINKMFELALLYKTSIHFYF